MGKVIRLCSLMVISSFVCGMSAWGSNFTERLPLDSTFEQLQAAFETAAPFTFSGVASLPSGVPSDPQRYPRYVGENAQVMRSHFKSGFCKAVENGSPLVTFAGFVGLEVDGNLVFFKYGNQTPSGKTLGAVDDGLASTYNRVWADGTSGRTDQDAILLHQRTFLKGLPEAPTQSSKLGDLMRHYRRLPEYESHIITHPRLFDDRAIYYTAYVPNRSNLITTVFRNELRQVEPGFFILQTKRLDGLDSGKLTVAEIESKFQPTQASDVCVFYWDGRKSKTYYRE